MSALTRTEYRREERQERRVNESPFRETKWDRHLDTLLTDLSDSVGPTGQQGPRSGTVVEAHGVPGSGNYHERREYTSPDQRTRVVEERYQHTSQGGDSGTKVPVSSEEKTELRKQRTVKSTVHSLGAEPPTKFYYEELPSTEKKTTTTVKEYRHPPTVVEYHETIPSTQYYTKTTRTRDYQEEKPAPPPVKHYEPPTQTKQYTTTKVIRSTGFQDEKAAPAPVIHYDSVPVTEYHTTKVVKSADFEEKPLPAQLKQYDTVPVSQYFTKTSRTTDYEERPTPRGATVKYYETPVPVTVRHVDKKPITIYHEAKPAPPYVLEEDIPVQQVSPGSQKPQTVYYERIIERQPIIHYYGQRPAGTAETRQVSLPPTDRDTSHYSRVEYVRPESQPLQERTRSSQTVTSRQTYKSSYPQPEEPHPPPQSQVPVDSSRFKQNILELDSLLDDLDHARKKPHTSVDPGLNAYEGPSGTSTPYRQTNVTKTTRTTKQTTSQPPLGDHLTSVGLTGPTHSPSPNPLDGIDKNLVPELNEPPQPGTTRVTRYEYRSSNRREASPQPLPYTVPAVEPPSTGTTRYEYHTTSRRDISPQPTYSRPSDSLDKAPPTQPDTSSVSRYQYSSSTRREISPQPQYSRPADALEKPPPPSTDSSVTYNVYNVDNVPVPPVVAPQVPAPTPGSTTTINYHIYNYGTLGPDGQPVLPPGVVGTLSRPPSAPGTLQRPPSAQGTLPPPQTQTSATTTTYRYYEQEPPPQQQQQPPPPPPQTQTSATTTTYRYYEQEPPPQQQPAPRPASPPGPDTTLSSSYVYEKHSSSQPPPQPQPQHPDPHRHTSTTTVTKHYTIGPDGREIPVRPGSPYDGQYPKFPVDEGQPGHPPGHHTRTTTTTIERTHTHGSPFPARSPSPSVRRPQRDDGPRRPFPGAPYKPVDNIDTPRRVDELMATIPRTPQDGTYPDGPRRRELNGKTTTTTHFTVHESEPLLDRQTRVTLDAKSGAVVPHTPTKPIAGPPVYYPPGSTDFKPRPEGEMMFQSYESRGRGKYKSGYKASGKYKAKSGSRETHAEGGAVIPICLPLCCGAACTVM